MWGGQSYLRSESAPWREHSPIYYDPLQKNWSGDCCIIGAGIAGLSIAYELTLLGYKPLIIDKGPVGGGQSRRSTAHVSYAFDDGFKALRHTRGVEDGRIITKSQWKGFQRIRHHVETLSSDCDYRQINGYLFRAPQTSVSELQEEMEAALELGVPVDLVERTPGLNFKIPALRFPYQAQMDLQQYMHSLAHAIVAAGGQIYCETEARELFAARDGHTPHGLRVYGLEEQFITADHIIVATQKPDRNLLPDLSLHQRQESWRTYAIAVKMPKGQLPPVLYWDTANWSTGQPFYHHIRVVEDKRWDYDLAVIGGEDHKADQPSNPQHYSFLKRWAKQLIPNLSEAMDDVVDVWSGTVMEPCDYTGFIGETFPGSRIHVCTGDSGHGIVQSAVAGMLISDIITDRKNPWREVYRPDRFDDEVFSLSRRGPDFGRSHSGDQPVEEPPSSRKGDKSSPLRIHPGREVLDLARGRAQR